MYFKSFVRSLLKTWVQNNSPWIIALRYGDFWSYRRHLTQKHHDYSPRLYLAYLSRFNASIGINARLADVPVFPHNLSGIFISNSAKIGKGVIIYHHVTIGSNIIKDSKTFGAPTIEDGVLIGAGAKIIGNVTIGKNSRIGAGCVVTKSVPANSVIVMQAPRIIEKDSLTNVYVSNYGNH